MSIPRVKGFKQVSESFNTYLHDDPLGRMYNVLSLCYEQLPYHLRKCFLYVGMFPEDCEIPTLKLNRMWIAEGFIQEDNISLEETAEKYLDDLINSNLLRPEKLKADGKVKTCRVHSTVRDFCRTEAANEREICFQEINMSRDGGFQPPVSENHTYQRLCIHSNVSDFLSTKPYCPSVSSFVCFSKDNFSVPTEHVSAIPAGFKLLRVLDIIAFNIYTLSRGMYQLLHLRYPTMFFDSAVLHEDFSKFRNIQTLVVYTTQRTLDVEADILNMTELRHFKTNASATLPEPGTSSGGGEKIQTLGTISPESCTEEVFGRARNLKKLGIRGKIALLLEDNNQNSNKLGILGKPALFLKDKNRPSFDSLGKLENLEKLKLINDAFPGRPSAVHGLPPSDKFPIKLRSLTLCETILDWSKMSVLESLENLEVLKLKDCAFLGRSWEATDGGFPHLEVLHIGLTNLQIWVASHHHFPKLKCLKVRDCLNLREVPLVLADVPSFQCLDLHWCSRTAASSAKRIYEAKREQEDQQLGNVRQFSLSIFPPGDDYPSL